MLGSAPQNAQQTGDVIDSDEFRMYYWKVLPCRKRYSHDWSDCVFAHTGEKVQRRCPRKYNYKGFMCPHVKQDGSCPRRDSCCYAHNPFEYWLHPTRYRTELCTFGTSCKRPVCFFAHTPAEVRQPGNVMGPPSAHTGGPRGTPTMETAPPFDSEDAVPPSPSTSGSYQLGAPHPSTYQQWAPPSTADGYQPEPSYAPAAGCYLPSAPYLGASSLPAAAQPQARELGQSEPPFWTLPSDRFARAPQPAAYSPTSSPRVLQGPRSAPRSKLVASGRITPTPMSLQPTPTPSLRPATNPRRRSAPSAASSTPYLQATNPRLLTTSLASLQPPRHLLHHDHLLMLPAAPPTPTHSQQQQQQLAIDPFPSSPFSPPRPPPYNPYPTSHSDVLPPPLSLYPSTHQHLLLAESSLEALSPHALTHPAHPSHLPSLLPGGADSLMMGRLSIDHRQELDQSQYPFAASKHPAAGPLASYSPPLDDDYFADLQQSVGPGAQQWSYMG